MRDHDRPGIEAGVGQPRDTYRAFSGSRLTPNVLPVVDVHLDVVRVEDSAELASHGGRTRSPADESRGAGRGGVVRDLAPNRGGPGFAIDIVVTAT